MMTIDELIEALELERITFGGDAQVGISAQEFVGETLDGKKTYKWKVVPIERVAGATKCTYNDLDQKDKCVVIIPPIFNDLFVNLDPVEKIKKINKKINHKRLHKLGIIR